jgi:hypothetical protein
VWAPVVPALLPGATFDLATTLPAELTRGGTFGVHSGSLPSGSTLTAAGILQAGDADGSSTVVFRYRMATATADTYSAETGVTVRGGVVAAAPAWLQSVPVNGWTEIDGSSMSNLVLSVNPSAKNPANMIAAWGTMCIDTRTSDLWMLAPGGHSDFYGNPVLRQRLSVDAPEWEERLASSASGDVTASSARYTDGRPASAHGYWSHQFIEARDRAMRFQTAAAATIGDSFNVVEAFDSTVAQGVNGWAAAGTVPNITAVTSTAVVTAKDPDTEDVYFFRANVAVYKWTQATNLWSTVTSSVPVTFSESAPAFDSARGRILLYKRSGGDGGAATQLYTFNVGAGTFTSRTFSGDAAAIATLQAAGKGLGVVYEPELDAYLIRLKGSGGAVYKVTADDSLTVSELPTTGGTSLPAAAVADGTENIYGRMLYAPALNGVVYVPSYAANVWFLRTH